jgi:hypothetical protein
MAEYHVTADAQRHFTATEGTRPVGELAYPKWFAFDATLSLPNQAQYQIKPKGFWGTTIELLQDGHALLRFKMDWNGNIIIHTSFHGREQYFVFKQQSLLKHQYVLTDPQEQELLVVLPDFKWKAFNYEYAITSTDAFEALADKDLLVLVAVYCANYYITVMTVAAN